MHHFNLSHLALAFQNNAFQDFFSLKIMQTVHLKSAMWDEVKEVLIIILPVHQTLYQL